LAEAEAIKPVTEAAGKLLVEVADRAIVAGLDDRRSLGSDPSELHADLRQRLGTFVTLTVRGELNGCIGSIESDEPLGVSVARHAWSAAFADPRLPPLGWSDYEHLDIEVSILSSLTTIPVDSRAELVNALRPGTDGLLIGAGARRAVFLPAVWDQLPSPADFVEHLFRKAGLSPTLWPGDLRASRFIAQKIRRTDTDAERS